MLKSRLIDLQLQIIHLRLKSIGPQHQVIWINRQFIEIQLICSSSSVLRLTDRHLRPSSSARVGDHERTHHRRGAKHAEVAQSRRITSLRFL